MFYEYKCDNCGHIIEIRRSIKEAEIIQHCSICGMKVRRIYGGHQINMNNWQSRIHEYNKLPEHAKTGDTRFLK